jgi:HEPN domain-containing protein
MNRVEDWLLAADLDLKAARGSLNEDAPNIACFLSHQAVEKALKAILLQQNLKVPKIHSLIELLDKAMIKLTGLKGYEQSVIFMNQFYIPTRYPDALPGSLPEGLPTKDVAEKAIAYATEIVEFIKPLLKS